MLELQFVPAAESVAAVQRHAQILARITQADPNVMEEVAEAIRDGFFENFSNESAGNGAPWVALADWTQRERERGGFGAQHPILVRTGGYRASWVDAGAAGHVSIRESDGMGWTVGEGSSDSRTSVLESGGVTDTGHIVPPRPVSLLSESAEQEISRRIMAWLTRTLP
jgi:phage gpG-like protein